MRKILLLTVLIIGYYLPTFSQLKSKLQSDTRLKNFSFNYTNTFRHIDFNDFNGLLNGHNVERDFLIPNKLTYKNLHSGQNASGIVKTPQPFYNMPCLKPNGFFSMPIYKPDSSINYTLLIKRY
jgi:hypothetical protein